LWSQKIIYILIYQRIDQKLYSILKNEISGRATTGLNHKSKKRLLCLKRWAKKPKILDSRDEAQRTDQEWSLDQARASHISGKPHKAWEKLALDKQNYQEEVPVPMQVSRSEVYA
jgi:hypothetical protein